MKKSLSILSLLAMLLLAQAPSMLAQKDERQANLNSLVEAERDFARAAGTKGTKDAFLEFAADDGVVFRRTAVNAKETWRQAPASKGLLSWQPIFADVSRAGDLGYTTGPFEFRENPTDKEPAGQGNYMTIWKRQADGSWKFALDMGATSPKASAPAPPLSFAPDKGRARGDKRSAVNIESERASLLRLEREFSAQAMEKGTGEAYLSRLADDARLFRQNTFPLVGLAQIRASLKAQTDALAWQPAQAFVSISDDLGYAYGTYEARERAGDAKPKAQGNYVRIWKRQPDHQWKIVVDVMNPGARPPRRSCYSCSCSCCSISSDGPGSSLIALSDTSRCFSKAPRQSAVSQSLWLCRKRRRAFGQRVSHGLPERPWWASSLQASSSVAASRPAYSPFPRRA